LNFYLHRLFEFNSITIPKNNEGELKGKKAIQEEQQAFRNNLIALH